MRVWRAISVPGLPKFRAFSIIGASSTLALLSGCATTHSVAPTSPLPPPVREALVQAQLPLDALSFVVQRADSGRTIMAQQAGRPNVPASVMKMVTTYAALEVLGPTHRPRTQLVTSAPRMGTVLEGDVALVGGGSTDFDQDGLRRMLSAMRQSGIDEIRGALVLDRSLFLPERFDLGVAPFDESPEFGYNVIPDALTLRSNLLSYRIASDGKSVTATLWPALPNIRVRTNLTIADFPCKDWEDRWKIPRTTKHGDVIEVELHGEFPRHCATTQQLNVIDPDEVLARVFDATWTELGGRWTRAVRIGRAPTTAVGMRVLAEHRGRTVAELVAAANKPSDNVHTRLLYLLLGVSTRAAQEGSLAASERVIRQWLRSKQIDDSAFVFENGSGLSRIEKIPTAQLAALLRTVDVSPWSHEFIASLPIAGLDGTLRNRLKESPASGRARLKTGTLKDVVSLAGYVFDAKGERYVVVAFVNDPRASHTVARPAVDALVDWIARNDLSRL